MLTIAKLFGKSPFSPIQNHMKKVSGCVKKLNELFSEVKRGSYKKLEALARDLSKLEHEADLTKNDIRNHLPKSLFLPIDRAQLLEILSIQDSLADTADEIGSLFSLCPESSFSVVTPKFIDYFEKSVETFFDVRQIIKEFDELLESSFGGLEAEKVKGLVEQTSYKEYESDELKRTVRKEFFKVADTFPPSSFYLWIQIIDEIGSLSHISEKLANRVRMILEIK